MRSLACRTTILLFLLLSSSIIKGQGQQPIYLQIEELNYTDVIKYYPGQTLHYTTTDYPNTWRKSKILKIIPEDQLIVLETGYITPDKINSIRRKRTATLAISHGLSKFAAGWFIYGAYASIADSGYKMSWRDVIIGAALAGVGWVVRKLFKWKRYHMGKIYRLRIIDIRFPQPKFNTP